MVEEPGTVQPVKTSPKTTPPPKKAVPAPKAVPPAPKPKTAVKAKASKKENPPSSASVHASLHRAETVDIAGGSGKGEKDGENNEEEKDEEEEEEDVFPEPAGDGQPTLEDVQRKKAAHARFMRFSRSLTSSLYHQKYIDHLASS